MSFVASCLLIVAICFFVAAWFYRTGRRRLNSRSEPSNGPYPKSVMRALVVVAVLLGVPLLIVGIREISRDEPVGI